MTNIACAKTGVDPSVAMDKWSLLLGSLLSVWGVLIVMNPKYYGYVYGRYFDFTAYHVPLGIFVIALGLLFIVTGLRNKPTNLEEE